MSENQNVSFKHYHLAIFLFVSNVFQLSGGAAIAESSYTRCHRVQDSRGSFSSSQISVSIILICNLKDSLIRRPSFQMINCKCKQNKARSKERNLKGVDSRSLSSEASRFVYLGLTACQKQFVSKCNRRQLSNRYNHSFQNVLFIDFIAKDATA